MTIARRAKPVLRRYTSIPAVLDMLQQKRITLLNPDRWDDKNDAAYMREYGKGKKAKSVLALCFVTSPERYHHWRVFTHGSDGACVQFNRRELQRCVDDHGSIIANSVMYKKISAVKGSQLKLDELPFIKRLPYRDEREFRLVYISHAERIPAKPVPIDLECIQKIVLSPWMPDSLAEAVKASIRLIDGCSRMTVSRTTLLQNEDWLDAARGTNARR